MLDAPDDLGGLSGLEVGVDDVRRDRRAGVRGVDAVVGDEVVQVQLVPRDDVIAVRVVPVIVEPRQRAGVGERDGVGAELVRVLRVARAQERRLLLPERVGRADARDHVLPRERRRLIGRRDGRQKVRDDRVRRSRGAEVVTLLPVVPDARVDRQVAEGQRVRQVAAVVLEARVDDGIARHGRDRRVEVGEVAVVAVARPGRDRVDRRRPIVEAELQLVAEGAGVEEVGAARRGLLLRPDGVGEQVAADVLTLRVDVQVVDVRAALGRQRESRRHRRVRRRREEADEKI